MKFYLSNNGQPVGPYPIEQIKTFLDQALLSATDEIWAEGWPTWMTIGNVPGLSSTLAVQNNDESIGNESTRLETQPARPSPASGKHSDPSSEQKRSSRRPSWLRGDVATVVIGLLLGIVAPCLGLFSGSSKTAITSVLRQNSVLQNSYSSQENEIKINNDSDIDQWAQAARTYASNINAINTRGCPSDFRSAFMEYANKVAGLAEELSQHPHVTTDGEAALQGLIIAAIADRGGDEGLNQAGRVVADESNTDAAFVQEYAQRENEVRKAAANVDAIAAKYGVQIQN